MFPVPSHLPRKAQAVGNEHAASSPEASGSGSTSAIPSPVVDTVLDLFEPLFVDKQLKSGTVRNVRECLERATGENKRVTHELLKSNYSSISSHIRSGAQIKADFTSVQAKLDELESRIDPDNAETSFIAPVLALLRRHFTAVRSQSRSQAHARALKQLKAHVSRLDKLEEAVYSARSADEEVVAALCDQTEAEDAALAKSAVYRTIRSRKDLLQSMAVDQIVDGLRQAISIKDDGPEGSTSLTVQHTVVLQKPRNARPGSSATAPDPPSYPLPQIYSALSRTESLAGPLRQLHTQLVERMISPVLKAGSTVERDDDGTAAILRLTISASPGSRSPQKVLQDLSTVFDFVKASVIPKDTSIAQARRAFLSELHSTTSRMLLSELVLPLLPPDLTGIADWLDTVRAAAEFEAQTRASAEDGQASSLRTFLDETAGSAWANARRRRAAEETRTLVLSGWQGWEATEISRDKEISVVVEVEIEEEADEPMPPASSEQTTSDQPVTTDKPLPAKLDPFASKVVEEPVENEEEGGWGFDEESSVNQAGPSTSSPKRNGHAPAEEVDDGWAFDDDLSTPAPAPAPVVAPKPTREAKKLGKRVAKAKAPGSDDEDMGATASDMSRTNSIQQPATPPPPPAPAAEPIDWEAWEDETPATAKKPKAKRKELREEKRTIKETFLVSKACDTLLRYAEDVLHDAQTLESDLPAPSFSLAPPILYHTATEVFDLYRALITSHFAAQLQSVPTLSMQVYNDSIHLSDRVEAVSSKHPTWSSSDTQRRLRESGEACFERELERQRGGLVTTLDGIEWGRGVDGLKRSLAVPKQVRNDLEDLSRMFHTVLPTTTFLSVMGYLVNVAISYVTDAILSQQDITEDESIQLTELLRILHPLEDLFILEPGQPSSVVTHVHGWLKFCYLLELLSANLVDITYLFENGALVDFTADELISLLKALFADSEKREKAIERIEQGL